MKIQNSRRNSPAIEFKVIVDDLNIKSIDVKSHGYRSGLIVEIGIHIMYVHTHSQMNITRNSVRLTLHCLQTPAQTMSLFNT